MLVLFKKDGTPIQSFANDKELYRPLVHYRELCRHITYEENEKLFEDHPQFGQTMWSFLYISPQQVTDLVPTMKKKCDEKIFLEAHLQGLGVVEACEGNLDHIRQILVTPDVNVEALRKEWCKKYCKVHGYGLFEISTSHNFNLSEGQEGKNGGRDGQTAE